MYVLERDGLQGTFGIYSWHATQDTTTHTHKVFLEAHEACTTWRETFVAYEYAWKHTHRTAHSQVSNYLKRRCRCYNNNTAALTLIQVSNLPSRKTHTWRCFRTPWRRDEVWKRHSTRHAEALTAPAQYAFKSSMIH